MSYPHRYLKDGKIAVLISPGYEAGWSTWNSQYAEEFLFDVEIAAMLDRGESYEVILKKAEEKWPDSYCCGLDQLKIVWVDPGTTFQIDEYDGSESLCTQPSYYVA